MSENKSQHILLSDMQNQAIERIKLWHKEPVAKSQIFYLAGYAGTGKTSMIYFILQSLGIKISDCCFATYTGKAALVMSSKTGYDVSTIHSLCYELVDEDVTDNDVVKMNFRVRKNSPLRSAKLLIVDEVSMVSKDMMEDIKKFRVKILVLGDPFQLKPVEGDAYFHPEYKPDFFLTEIHRQALENPIIWLSQQVRLGNDIKFGHYGDSVKKIRWGEAGREEWEGADQVICGTNKTRREVNRWFRAARGFNPVDNPFPVIGDKMICLRNRWDDGMVNGMMLRADSTANPSFDQETFTLSFTSLDVAKGDTPIVGIDMQCSSADVLGIKLTRPWYEVKKLVSIDYGYAITCHKSQGSQYEDVMFLDEGFGRWLDDNTYYRHLYTGITRASDNLIILE